MQTLTSSQTLRGAVCPCHCSACPPPNEGRGEITSPHDSGRCTESGVSCPADPTPASSSCWVSPGETVLGEGALTGTPGRPLWQLSS